MDYKKSTYRGYDVITPAIWPSEPIGTFAGAVWDYLPPINECRLTFKRRDGRELFYPDTGSLVALSLNEAEDLYSILWPAIRIMKTYNMALDREPYVLLNK